MSRRRDTAPAPPDGIRANRIVPPTGFTARLVLLGAAAMVFLAVFAIALATATVRLGAAWQTELAGTATLSLPADLSASEMAVATEAALAVLRTTPGVVRARVVPDEEARGLLAPWFGRDLPLDALPLPRLIEVTTADLDARALRLRLGGEVPRARLDDHDLWRAPLADAQARMRALAWGGLGLIFATLAAITALAAQASLAANGQVIEVLRLVGARDAWIARAFVRRITLRAFAGGVLGAAAAVAVLAAFPATGAGGLPGLRPEGLGWAAPALLPPFAAAVAFVTTHLAARAMLKGRP